MAADLGARVIEMPVRHRARSAGRSKYGIGRTVRVVLDLLTIKFLSGFSTRPLHVFGVVGLVLALVGFGLIAELGYERIVLGIRLGGRPIVLLAILLGIVGVQFISMGLVGEMVMRTYHESQAKPIFRVREVREARVGTRGEPIEHLH